MERNGKHSLLCLCIRWFVMWSMLKAYANGEQSPNPHSHTNTQRTHWTTSKRTQIYICETLSIVCITCVRITFWLTWCVTTSVYDINKRTNEMYLVFSSIDGPTSWYDNGVKEKSEKKSNQNSVKSLLCTIYAWRNLWAKYHKILQCLREQQTDVGWKIS